MKQQKQPTAKQLAARKANAERLKKMHAEKAAEKKANKVITEAPELAVTDTPQPDVHAMQRQIDQLMEMNTLFMADKLRNLNNQPTQGVGVGRNGSLIGEVDKYLVDPQQYPDPTARLSDEKRLETIAFKHNYELMYQFSIRSYETKTGINMREPEFLVTLLRRVLDDQGNPVKVQNASGELVDKYYIARRMMFHEDPQAALVIARENNLLVDKEDEKTFLDEMRYIRVRDWLFDFLWPRPSKQADAIREESVGGTLVQVFTKSSVEPSSVDFDKLDSKI